MQTQPELIIRLKPPSNTRSCDNPDCCLSRLLNSRLISNSTPEHVTPDSKSRDLQQHSSLHKLISFISTKSPQNSCGSRIDRSSLLLALHSVWSHGNIQIFHPESGSTDCTKLPSWKQPSRMPCRPHVARNPFDGIGTTQGACGHYAKFSDMSDGQAMSVVKPGTYFGDV
jgi:hypothetical protein